MIVSDSDTEDAGMAYYGDRGRCCGPTHGLARATDELVAYARAIADAAPGKPGHGRRAIARTLGVSPKTVRYWLELYTRAIPPRATVRISTVLSLHRQGISARAIARQLGVGPKAIRTIIRRHSPSPVNPASPPPPPPS